MADRVEALAKALYQASIEDDLGHEEAELVAPWEALDEEEGKDVWRAHAQAALDFLKVDENDIVVATLIRVQGRIVGEWGVRDSGIDDVLQRLGVPLPEYDCYGDLISREETSCEK